MTSNPDLADAETFISKTKFNFENNLYFDK